MTDSIDNTEILFLGDTPPLRAGGRRLPDKRRVSLRWLSGAVLAGLTSAFLMGGALFAALDGRQQLALPAQAYEFDHTADRPVNGVIKGARPGLQINAAASDSNIMMVSTVSREGTRDIVKVRPFLNIETALAAAPTAEFDYPRFDALAVFSESGKAEPISQSSDLIYGAEVESEVTISLVDFDPESPFVASSPKLLPGDIEKLVRNAAPALGSGTTSVASLSYVDPARFSIDSTSFPTTNDVIITAENVSVLKKQTTSELTGIRYEERLIKVRSEAEIATILIAEGMDQAEAELLQKVLSSDLGSENLYPDDRIRVIYEIKGPEEDRQIRPGRISIYRNASHMVSIARTDGNRFVYAPTPEPIPELAEAGSSQPIIPASRLPTAYDAIYRSALSQGMSVELAAKLIRIFAFDVDFNARIAPADELSAFVSLEDGQDKPTETSEILFASVKLGSVTRKYYRFRDTESGRVDYYDETGKSAKKFLLRQPVPNGRFNSPFGKRWHPILKTRKMHWGVDWAAPRGTPILSSGDGKIVSAGWKSGYGKHTIIRHANGYVTTYSHQTKIAKGVTSGGRVRQGQVIGYVGSTGLSTGPHLHYEVIVNGTKVDPMRIRLPKGKVLQDIELASFQAERDRIDDLLRDEDDEAVDLASAR